MGNEGLSQLDDDVERRTKAKVCIIEGIFRASVLPYDINMTQDPETPSAYLFQTSQPRELLACAEFAAVQARLVHDDHGAWRWLTISLVLAVQNACLCALDSRDEDGTNAMRRADARRIRRWRETGGRSPPPRALSEPRIVSVLELVNRVSDRKFLPPPYQLPLETEAEERFSALVELRNTFLHFSEDGWSFDLREAPPLALSACDIIRHLAVTQPTYLSRAERGHRNRIAHALDDIEAAMEHFADIG
jgi:hypothetical protein